MRQDTLNIRISVYRASDDVNKLTPFLARAYEISASVGPPELINESQIYDTPKSIATYICYIVTYVHVYKLNYIIIMYSY